MTDKTGRILHFPVRQRQYVPYCLDCKGTSWEIVVTDYPEGPSSGSLLCANPKCQFWTNIGIIWPIGDDDETPPAS